MHVSNTLSELKILNIYKPQVSSKVLVLFILLLILLFCYVQYSSYQNEQSLTSKIISNPKINDIYFVDVRLLKENLRPNEKYKIAKVVDITGDVITLLYGRFYYLRQHAAINSIQYGQLSYKDYFSPKRYDIPLDQIKGMLDQQAIYLAKRPIRNKLYGSLVGPEKTREPTSYLIYGKNENIKGEAFLKQKFSETNLKTAFELFKASSDLGYVKGQVNLAEMYINGLYVTKDFNQALYWLKQASLQSYKPAILKYGVICKQIKSCSLFNFYQELTVSGVNIKVRKFDVELNK